MIKQIGRVTRRKYECDACGKVFIAEEMPARCPNASCRVPKDGKPRKDKSRFDILTDAVTHTPPACQ